MDFNKKFFSKRNSCSGVTVIKGLNVYTYKYVIRLYGSDFCRYKKQVRFQAQNFLQMTKYLPREQHKKGKKSRYLRLSQ